MAKKPSTPRIIAEGAVAIALLSAVGKASGGHDGPSTPSREGNTVCITTFNPNRDCGESDGDQRGPEEQGLPGGITVESALGRVSIVCGGRKVVPERDGASVEDQIQGWTGIAPVNGEAVSWGDIPISPAVEAQEELAPAPDGYDAVPQICYVKPY